MGLALRFSALSSSRTGRSHYSALVIMEAALGNVNHAIFDTVNQPIFLRDATRPVTGQIVFERLRLAKTRKGIALDALDEVINALGDGGLRRRQ